MLCVGWAEPDEWIKYTVEVKQTGLDIIILFYTSNRGGEIALSVNDRDEWRQWHHWNQMSGIARIKLE
jgi:hypothetical protein